MSTRPSSGQFICAPVKKTWEVDLTRPLGAFITATYQNVHPEEYNQALTDLQRLRNHYITKVNERHESTLDLCCRYADQLAAIESKFPIDENQIRVAFRWQDAFVKRIQQLSSGTFERLCATFNVAAIQSQIADIQNVTTDEGLKAAAKLFQQSSGTFAHLQNTIPSLILSGELTPDLWPDTLGALSALMLAQAQDCFVRKGMADSMKPGVVAKLASQCATLYGDAHKLMTVDKVKSVWPREWLVSVQGRQEAARGLAEYHQSLVAKEAKNFGEQVARLRAAKDCLARSLKLGSPTSSQSANARLVSDALAQAEKDNGLIYNALVPDPKTLPPIDKAPLAKALPPGCPLGGEGFHDLFERFVPIPVQVARASFENRKSELLHQEIGRLRSNTQALNGLLASLNLPAAIEDVAGGGAAVPQSLLAKAATVRRAGGIQHLSKLTAELPSLLKCNTELLDECDRLLNEEEGSDRQLRAQFRQGWTRTPSEALNGPIRAEAQRYRMVINNAVQADSNIRQRFVTNQESIALLSQTDTDIERALPSTGGGVGASLQGHPAVATLRSLMDQVQSIRKDRDELETQLKDAPCTDMSARFLAALAQDGAIRDEQGLSLEQLDRVYGQLRNRVAQSVQRQDTITEQIQRASREFADARGASSRAGGGAAMATSREQKLKQLAAAYDAFAELKKNIEEGVRFYNALTDMLVHFQGKVTDFCLARKTEKDEHLRDLTSGLAGAAGPLSPTSPTSPGAFGHFSGGGAPRLTSSFSIGGGVGGGAGISHSSMLGGKTTLTIGGGINGGGYCLPAMPGGFNPYQQLQSMGAPQGANQGFGGNRFSQRR